MNTRQRRTVSSRVKSVSGVVTLGRGDFSETEDAQLYGALLKFGPLDLENLKCSVPSRSEYQIKQRILTLQKKAQASLRTVPKRLKNGTIKLETRDKVAIDKWLDKMYVLHQKEQITTGTTEELPVRMLARTIGYIAKFEDHPTPEECEGVNLRNVYEFIESMMMGLPSKTLPSPDARFLLEGLQNLSTTIDGMDLSREYSFITCQRPDWSLNGKTTRTYGKKQQDLTMDELSSFLASSHYNPFNVPAGWLKKTADGKD